MAKKMGSPEEIAKKWERNASAASTSMTEGIKRVDVSPTHEAAKHIDKYLQNIQKAVQEGRVKSGLESVSLEDWKKATLEKGVSRYIQSIPGATHKMARAMTILKPHIEAGQAIVAKMPHLTVLDGAEKAKAMVIHMGKAKGLVKKG